MTSATLRIAVLCVAAATTLAYTVESAAAPPVKEDGIYTISFAFGIEGLVLIAHIEDTSENPATDGVVRFQYCAFKGVSPMQPDEAPSSACLNGSGSWRTLHFGQGVPVTLSGDALGLYGQVSPAINVIGFRYKYTRGSEIADGVLDPPVDWIRQ